MKAIEAVLARRTTKDFTGEPVSKEDVETLLEVATFAPGRLLLMQIIENGAADGLRCIDRGEGDSAAKRDFATGEQRYYRGAWTRGLGGIAARGVQSAVWRIQALRQRMQVRNQER